MLKRFDQTSTEFLMGLRAAYFAIVALNTLVQMILQWRIGVRDDPTPVTSFNPLAMLMGGGGNAKKTAAQYDREQLNCTAALAYWPLAAVLRSIHAH